MAESEGRSLEVIDLRSLSPLDLDTLTASARRTGRVVVVHEAPTFAGLGAEIAAAITERCFPFSKRPSSVSAAGTSRTRRRGPKQATCLTSTACSTRSRSRTSTERRRPRPNSRRTEMTEAHQFALPDVGEGLTEAEIVKWHVQPGDTVAVNDTLVEVETAKSLVELPSPHGGVVAGLHAAEGETVAVGSVLVSFGNGAAPEEERQPVLVGYGAVRECGATPSQTRIPGTRAAVHAVHAVHAGHGAGQALCHATGPAQGPATGHRPGHGDPDRLARPDHARRPRSRRPHDGEHRRERGAHRGTNPDQGHTQGHRGGDGLLRLHRSTRHRMGHRRRHRILDAAGRAPRRQGIRRREAHTAGADRACGPVRPPGASGINAKWDAEANEIVRYRDVNLGIATATPRGLLVPNIKAAQKLSTRELCDALSELITRAREGKTPPETMARGTFTITNIGVFGVDGGTPILNPGEAGILGVGQISRRPWEHQGEVTLRSVCTLSLSFDHRLVDGQLGSEVLAHVARLLAQPSLALVH